MKTLQMMIELQYDADIMHGDDQEARDWFINDILQGDGGLSLYSSEIGDTIGAVRVIQIVSQ